VLERESVEFARSLDIIGIGMQTEFIHSLIITLISLFFTKRCPMKSDVDGDNIEDVEVPTNKKIHMDRDVENQTITSLYKNMSKPRRRESDEITFSSQAYTSMANILGNTTLTNSSLADSDTSNLSANTTTRRYSSSTMTSEKSSTFTPVTAVKPRATLDTMTMMEDKENIKPKVLMVSGWTRKSMRVPKGK
jgi:hypothetical protein